MNLSVSDGLTCFGCIWEGACYGNVKCNDYSPIDEEESIAYYLNILFENQQELLEQLKEFEN